MITSLGLKTIRRSNKNKKTRHAITNVSLKDIYNIIKDCENLPYEGYVRKIFKHEPTYSYFVYQDSLLSVRRDSIRTLALQ